MDTQQLTSLKVLVVGDYCIDVFKYGSISRLSPEAPVPVFLYENEIKTEGMAGNVFNNIKSLGASCVIKHSDSDVKKVRYVDSKSKYHLLRADYEQSQASLDISNIVDNNYDAVVVADYNKGTITREVFEALRQKFTCPFFIDSKKHDISIFDDFGCIIKINELEYLNLNKVPSRAELIVTLGGNGASHSGYIYPTKKVEVYDVSGAGDSFMAGLVVQYLLTKNFKQAIEFANICAANVVSKTGTAIIDFKEIKNDLRF